VLTFFGFMHGEAIGIAVTPTVAVAYLIVAGFIFSLGRYPQFVAMEVPGPKPVAHPAPAE
jgi:AGZA family xanthine/uracil permease-like MFS transporter